MLGLFGKSQDFRLGDHMQRAAVSIACNIGEGCERKSDDKFIRFPYISKASLCELITQLEMAKNVGHIPEDPFLVLIGK